MCTAGWDTCPRAPPPHHCCAPSPEPPQRQSQEAPARCVAAAPAASLTCEPLCLRSGSAQLPSRPGSSRLWQRQQRQLRWAPHAGCGAAGLQNKSGCKGCVFLSFFLINIVFSFFDYKLQITPLMLVSLFLPLPHFTKVSTPLTFYRELYPKKM